MGSSSRRRAANAGCRRCRRILKRTSRSAFSKGIGSATAARIVERFGERTFSVLRGTGTPRAHPGDHARARKKIQHQFNERMELRRLLEFVSEHGLSPEIGMRLYRRHGALAASIVTNNPYVLVDAYYGVTFPLADLFARDLGLADDSPMRFDAAMKYVLIHNLSNGHVFIPAGKLCAAAALAGAWRTGRHGAVARAVVRKG